MNARVLPLETAAHGRLELLLPWYVNGTLSGSEQAMVQGHLERCSRCRAEVDFQGRLRKLGDVPGVVDNTALGWEAICEQLVTDAPRRHRPSSPRRQTTRWSFAWAMPAAASLAIAMVLSGAAPRPGAYLALGSTGTAPAANALVVFEPGTSPSQILATLRAVEARLVGGPTASDAYLVQLPLINARSLDDLRACPGVIVAESLVAGSAP